MSIRFVLAAGAAGLGVVCTASVALYFVGLSTLNSSKLPASSFGHLIGLGFLFGWPIAFAFALAIGGIGIRSAGRRNLRLTWPAVALTWAIVGGVVLPVIWAVLWNDLGGIAVLGSVGVVSGMVGGTCFWLLAPRMGSTRRA